MFSLNRLLAASYGLRRNRSAGDVDRVKPDVQITEHRQEERVVNANMIGDFSLESGNDRAAHDGRNQQAGTFAGERSQAFNGQGEDAGEHYGVEQADQEQGPHGNVAQGEHGNGNQHRGHRGVEGQERVSAHALQKTRAKEAANHGAAPVIKEVAGGTIQRKIADVRLIQIVSKETANGDFRANVGEDGNGAEDKAPVTPYVAVCSRVGFSIFD